MWGGSRVTVERKGENVESASVRDRETEIVRDRETERETHTERER